MYHLLCASEWDVNNLVIACNYKSVRVDEDDNYKRALLYFFMVCYAVKYYLNGQSEAEIYLNVIVDEVPDFENAFEKWIGNNAKNLL